MFAEKAVLPEVAAVVATGKQLSNLSQLAVLYTEIGGN